MNGNTVLIVAVKEIKTMNKEIIKEAIIDSQIFGSLKGCQKELEELGLPSEMVDHVCKGCHGCDLEW